MPPCAARTPSMRKCCTLALARVSGEKPRRFCACCSFCLASQRAKRRISKRLISTPAGIEAMTMRSTSLVLYLIGTRSMPPATALSACFLTPRPATRMRCRQ
ncbi:hypothetical protein D3C80_1916760 [compost metagenome]